MMFKARGNRSHNTPVSGIKKMRKMQEVVGYPHLRIGAPVQLLQGTNYAGKTGGIIEIRFGHITRAWCDYDIQVALTGGPRVWVRKEHLQGI